MESIKSIAKKVHPQLMQQQQSQNTSFRLRLKDDGEVSLSIYTDTLTAKGLSEEVSRIMKAFPALPVGFYDILGERIKELEISDKRLHDAISQVIDNCHYPTPTIADFVRFDKYIRSYTYHQMIKMYDEGDRDIWDSYKPIKFKGLPKPTWVHVNDIAKYNIQNEEELDTKIYRRAGKMLA